MVLPLFGEQSIPQRVRLGLGLSITLLVMPAVADRIGAPPTGLGGGIAGLLPEAIIGLFFGMLLRFFVFALQVAGSIAAQSTSLSQIFGGSAGVDPQPAMGRVFVVAGLALAALSGLHVQVVSYILISYQLAPFGLMLLPDVVMDVGIAEVGRAFALGFTLAAPFVVASFIYNVTLGVINRAMPQLMVSFVGAPAITAGGLLLMMVAAPVLLMIWMEAFSSFLSNPVGLRQ